ncbi:MFS transporter [Blastococcus xanthinilyticus]|uniref:Putative MFS family arabinose efflux permease n=1 Tax=Blastococcus xanthinilyticus TaxID=1564164 RepID=A0A5S5CKQ9_9ACTN|nr:MFS transporter [Blastococcus xanthinilyticus]TYP81257.1 putative MFS family arabinose efflux permease [Blastococcus xanthinilyticus]
MALGGAFWRFWCATVLANVGDGIRLAAFPLLAAGLTDDPVAVGLVAAAAALPWLVTGLIAGSLADRRSTRALLITADASRAVVLLGLIAVLLADRASIPLVAGAAFVLGVAETVRDTAAQTAVPRLVPAALLERANGRLVAGEVAGNEFVGPLVGGTLFAAGAWLPFAVNSAVAALGVLLVLTVPATLLALRAPVDPGDRPVAVAGGIRAGLRWLGGHRVLRRLVLVGVLVALADSAWFAVLVLYADARLGLGPVGFGVLLAAGAIGGLLGASLAERLIAGRRHAPVLRWSTAVATGAPVLLVAAPTRWAAVGVVVATSAAFGTFNVAALSLRHRLVPEQVLGRVVAAWRTAVLGAGALGALAGGTVASAYGLEAPFLLSAVLGAAAVVLWGRIARGGPAVAG